MTDKKKLEMNITDIDLKDSLKIGLVNIPLKKFNKVENLINIINDLNIETLTVSTDKDNQRNIFISGKDYNGYKVRITKDLLSASLDNLV